MAHILDGLIDTQTLNAIFMPQPAPMLTAVATTFEVTTNFAQLSSVLLHTTVQELDLLKGKHSQQYLLGVQDRQQVELAYNTLISAVILQLSAIKNAKDRIHRDKAFANLVKAYEVAKRQLTDVNHMFAQDLQIYWDRKKDMLARYAAQRLVDSAIVISSQDPWASYYDVMNQHTSGQLHALNVIRAQAPASTPQYIQTYAAPFGRSGWGHYHSFYYPHYSIFQPTPLDGFLIGWSVASLSHHGHGNDCGDTRSCSTGKALGCLAVVVLALLLLVACCAAVYYAGKKVVESIRHLARSEKIGKSLTRILGTAGGVAAGVMLGLLAGAAVGSAIPIIGTAIGAIVGAVIGGCFNAAIFAFLSKHVSRFFAKLKYGDTNGERWMPTTKQESHLKDCGYDIHAVHQGLRGLSREYHQHKSDPSQFDRQIKERKALKAALLQLKEEICEGRVMALKGHQFFKQERVVEYTPFSIKPADRDVAVRYVPPASAPLIDDMQSQYQTPRRYTVFEEPMYGQPVVQPQQPYGAPVMATVYPS